MKTLLRHSGLALPAGLLLIWMSAYPLAAQILYSNGPILGGDNSAVEFVGDLAVSDTFTLSGNSKMTGFDFGVWVLQGDTPLTVDWSITSKAQGGKSYASGVANLTNVFHNSWTEGHDAYTWNIYDSFASTNVSLGAGTYWLNLTNGVSSEQSGMYWDINKGQGCGGSDGNGANCPSLAYFNLVGKYDSEAFNISGGPQTPEPGSLALFGSGILGLGGLLRRRLLG